MPKNQKALWSQKGTKDQRRQRDRQSRQNAASTQDLAGNLAPSQEEERSDFPSASNKALAGSVQRSQEVCDLMNRAFIQTDTTILDPKTPEEILTELKKICVAGNPENYDYYQKIGNGTYGTVFKAVDKNTKIEVAIKEFDLTRKDMPRQSLLQSAFCEIRVLKDFNQHSLITIVSSHISEDKISIVMPLCDGTLQDILMDKYCKMGELEFAAIMKEVLLGVEIMHSKKYLHRDIKPNNILMTKGGLLKLADFGFTTDTKKFHKSLVGTKIYMAPEVAAKKNHTYACDIWSCGMVLVMMVVHSKEHNKSDEDFVFKKMAANDCRIEDIEKLSSWRVLSDDIKDFLKRCLEQDDAKRATASQLLDHKFLTNCAPTWKLGGLLERSTLHALKDQRSEKSFEKITNNEDFFSFST